MRFRPIWRLPTFSGYLSGLSLWRAVAYQTASGMGRALGAVDRLRARTLRQCFEMDLKDALRRAGVLRDPGKRDKAPPRPQEASPRPVLPAHPICVPPEQSYPAAAKVNGGVRGSKASRWT